jgi:hypothetical protein
MKEDHVERMAASNRPPLQATVRCLRPLSEVGPPTRFTIAREAEPREADEHHRPGRWFWSSDDEREVLVDPAPPSPFITARRNAEGAECLVVIGRGIRQGAAGDIVKRHAKKIAPADYGDEVSAAAIGIDGCAPTPEIHWSREAIVSVGRRIHCGPGGYAGLGGGQFRFVCPVAKRKSKAGQVDCAASCGDNVAPYLFKGHDIAGPCRASGKAKAERHASGERGAGGSGFQCYHRRFLPRRIIAVLENRGQRMTGRNTSGARRLSPLRRDLDACERWRLIQRGLIREGLGGPVLTPLGYMRLARGP